MGHTRWSGDVAAIDLWNNELLHLGDTYTKPAQDEREPQELTIELPTLDVLRQISGSCLVEIRRTAEAKHYFEIVKKWQRKTSPDCCTELLDSLRRYAEVICRCVGQRAQMAPHEAAGVQGKINILNLLIGAGGIVAADFNVPYAASAALGMFVVQEAVRYAGQGGRKVVARVGVTVGPRQPSAVVMNRDVTISRVSSD